MAFRIPAALFLLCLVKKLTVIGIIGNTQGVSKAANPDKKAIKNIDQRPFCFSGLEGDVSVFEIVGAFAVVSSGVEVATTFFVVSIAMGSASTFAAAGSVKLNFFSKLIQDSLQTW